MVICIRLLVVLTFTHLERWWTAGKDRHALATPGQAFFAGWCGMRGFVTIATAIVLPDSFPHRDTVILTAFTVVFETLVLQGLTVAPLVKLLKLDQREETSKRVVLLVLLWREPHSKVLQGEGPEAENVRYRFSLKLPSKNS